MMAKHLLAFLCDVTIFNATVHINVNTEEPRQTLPQFHIV